MKLASLMQEKQLDLNQPLRSVRRLPPSMDSEKGKPVPARKRARVPFLWEQSPGRPKAKNSINQNPNPILPKLPSGRILTIKRLVSGDSTEHRAKFQSSRDGGAFRDALETLARIESFFLNSFHGLDGKPSGIVLTDPDTTDFTADFRKQQRINVLAKFHKLLPRFCRKSSIRHEMRKFAKIEGVNGTRSSRSCSSSFRKLLGNQRPKTESSSGNGNPDKNEEDFNITANRKRGEFPCKPDFEESIKMLKDLAKDQNPWIGSASFRYYDSKKGNMEGEEDVKKVGSLQPQFPLLKSPSESWLRHKALPDMAAGKAPASRSQIAGRVKLW